MVTNNLQYNTRNSESLEYSEFAVLLIDENGNIRYQSSSCSSIIGINEEIKRFRDIFSCVISEDTKKILQIYKDIEEDQSQIYIPPLRIQVNSEIFHSIEGIITRIDNTSEMKGFIVCLRLIHTNTIVEEALKESEANYKNIVENLTDIYYRTDSLGRLVMASPSCLKTFGYSKMEDVLGQPISKIYSDMDGREKFLEQLRKSGRVKNFRTDLLRKDGSVIHVETTANVIIDKKGNYVGVEGIVRDITDREIALKALKESESRLRELNTTKDRLLSIIAHDLKSPFTSILGFSELLEENITSFTQKESEECIRHISSSAKNTLNLLENLLAWAKTQTGEISYKPIKTNFQKIVRMVINVMILSARIKNISINNLNSQAFYVNADPNMLQTILRNLIANAIKFTSPGGKVDIESFPDDTMVEIVVADTGIGMDEKTMGEIFEIDKNNLACGTENEKGSGLGLIICKEFIEKHGGKIWVESKPGIGTRFHFTLPLLR